MDFNFLAWLIICSTLTAFIVLAGIPKLIQLARLKHLFDDPEDDRKIHEKNIPNIGGVVILIALFTSFLLHPSAFAILGIQYLLAAVIILTIIGLKDDLLITSPAKKLIGQIIAVALLIFGAGIIIDDFEGVFGIQEIAAYVAVPLTFFVFIVIINAVNLIDGIDGLASSVVTFIALFFGVWFYHIGETTLFILSILTAVSFLAFLFYNWSPATVFMGDTGSLNAGLILAYLGIQYLNTSIHSPEIIFFQSSAPVILVAVFIIPLYDTLRVFLIRALEGDSPFAPDTNHIHHQYIELGLSHAQTTLILLFFNILLVTLTIILSQFLSNTLLLLSLVGMAMISFPTYRLKRRLLKNFLPEQVSVHTNSGGELKDIHSNGKHLVTHEEDLPNRESAIPSEKDQLNVEKTKLFS